MKVGTVISKRTATAEHLMKTYELLSSFDIDEWRIYEIIPENRAIALCEGDLLDSDDHAIVETTVKDMKKLNGINEITLVSRDTRNGQYLIALSDGNVVMPVENEGIVEEKLIGNLVCCSTCEILNNWQKQYKANMHFTDYLNSRLK